MADGYLSPHLLEGLRTIADVIEPGPKGLEQLAAEMRAVVRLLRERRPDLAAIHQLAVSIAAGIEELEQVTAVMHAPASVLAACLAWANPPLFAKSARELKHRCLEGGEQ